MDTANIGKYMIEELAGMPVEVDYAAEFRYRRTPIDARTLMIAVSQSGETADTLAAMEEGGARGRAFDRVQQHARFIDRAESERAAIHAMRSRDQCDHDQVLHHPDRGFLSVRDSSGGAAGALNAADAEALLTPAFAIPAQMEAIFAQRTRDPANRTKLRRPRAISCTSAAASIIRSRSKARSS